MSLANFPTGIPWKVAFFATFCAANDWEFHMETGNSKSSPSQSAQIGMMVALMDSPEDGWVDK